MSIEDLVECDDGTWRTQADNRAYLARRNWWVESIYSTINVCSYLAWAGIVALILWSVL
jgi:hypothetical protein